MQNPEKEIVNIVRLLTASTDADIQKHAVEQYYAPDVIFRHPFCSAKNRTDLLAIYRWYRIMSPSHTSDVRNVTYNSEKLELFLEVTQNFHIRWSPLAPALTRLIVHLKLRPCGPANQTTFLIAEHEDLYHPDDLIALVIPPLVPIVRAILASATLLCIIYSFVFSHVFGYWKVRDGVAAQSASTSLTDSNDHEQSWGGKGGNNTAVENLEDASPLRKRRRNMVGSYADVARDAVSEMQDKGLAAT